jgi:hypothetical protein
VIGRMTRMGIWVVAIGVAAVASGAVHAQSKDKVPIVAVAGCLAEQGTDWMLTSATEPEPSIANGPPAGQPYKGPTSGTHTFKLIGVSEFDLPSHKGHTVLVKGLYIKAEPVSRLNVTSVTMVSPTCPPSPK